LLYPGKLFVVMGKKSPMQQGLFLSLKNKSRGLIDNGHRHCYPDHLFILFLAD
jgi:hypothetical protein